MIPKLLRLIFVKILIWPSILNSDLNSNLFFIADGLQLVVCISALSLPWMVDSDTSVFEIPLTCFGVLLHSILFLYISEVFFHISWVFLNYIPFLWFVIYSFLFESIKENDLMVTVFFKIREWLQCTFFKLQISCYNNPSLSIF